MSTAPRISTAVYVCVAIVLVAAIWSFAWWLVRDVEERRLMRAVEQAERLAVFFEENIVGDLRYGDSYAKMVRREYLAGGIEAVRDVMADVPLDEAIVSHVTVIDDTGVPVFNSGFSIRPGASAADRDYFSRMRDAADDALYISLPHRGRNSGRLVVRLVRRITMPDGTFGGVLFAALDVDAVLGFFPAMNFGPRSSATLVGADKRIRARSTYGAVGPGQDISGSRIWRELEASPVGLYLQVSVVDGITRYYTYRELTDFPLIVAIGVAREDILEGLVSHRRNTLLVAALATVVISMITMVLVRERAVTRRLGGMRDALERRFEARSAELESVQAELLVTERLAVLGQLTGIVAHELRNPLNTIAASVAIIERKLHGSDADLGATTARLRRNIVRCEGIVNELLDFARAGGMDLMPTAVDTWLPELLDEFALPDGVVLEFTPGAPELTVALDRERVRRAIVNLVDNARDAIIDHERGGGRISVRTCHREGRIGVEVADTGGGMSPEVRARIHEPLFSTKAFGFGLGVPIVQRVADDHHGSLDIESASGVGTSVVLWIPLAQPPAQEDEGA